MANVMLVWDAPPDPATFARLSGVRWLRIREDKAQRADLSLLSQLPLLQELTLSTGRSRRNLTDLPVMPNLLTLKLWTTGALFSLRGLGNATNLRSLELRGQADLRDSSELRALKGLQSLCLSQFQLRDELGWLPGLTSLTELSFLPGDVHAPLPSLAALTSLKTLTLCVGPAAADLRPLSPLTALTELVLRGAADLDLQPLSALKRLRRLDLVGVVGRITIGGLSGLRSLSDLTFGEDLVLEGLCSLTVLPGVIRSVKIDKQGRPRLRRKILRGNALLVAASAGADLSAALHLDLKKCGSLTDLSPISHLVGLQSLSVRDCPSLAAAWSVIGMTGLESLDVGKCPLLRPIPARRLMEDPDSIHAYRRKLARSLTKKPQRTPAEESLLQVAQAADLLKPQPQVPSPKSLLPLRHMLSAPNPAYAQQGMEMLRALADPVLLADLSRGVSLEAGKVHIKRSASRRTHLRRLDRRYWMALSLLRLTGALEEAESLVLGRVPMLDLCALEGLSDLQHLSVEPGEGNPDSRALATLTGLKSLEYLRIYPGGDLSRLSQLQQLTLCISPEADLSSLGHLYGLVELDMIASRRLARLPAPRDDHFLSRLTSLKRLIVGHRKLSDLSMLGPLRHLEVLSATVSASANLAPLAELTSLTDLSIQLPPCPPGTAADLQPLAGLRSLKSLKLSGLGAANLEPLSELRALTYLKLNGSTQPPAVDLTPIASLKNLRQLALGFYVERANLMPLKALPKISHLHLAQSQGLPRDFPRWIGYRERLHSLLTE